MEKSTIKKQATLTDWAIVAYPAIYWAIEDIKSVVAKFDGQSEVALFGRAVSDNRYNEETGEFTDGHRLVTSPLAEAVGDKYYTENTIYILDIETQNKEYKTWCAINQ